VMLADNVVMASDLARVLVIYEYGGVYLDFD
jgi:mannosyltransferase OCH1-like enzyme